MSARLLDQVTRRVHLAVIPLRGVLVLTFLMLVLFQVMALPGEFVHDARSASRNEHLAWLLLVVTELLVVCMQVVIVCIWRLLGMVREDRIFSDRSLVWVDGIIWAIAAGWLLLFATSCYLAFYFDDPSQPIVLTMLLLIGAVFGLLMLVMRTLLWQATALRSDMDAVI